MNFPFGFSRTRIATKHALFAEDSFVPSVLPGITGVRVVSHITPGLGAKFMQSTLTFEIGGEVKIAPDGTESFFYVQSGQVRLSCSNQVYDLMAGGFAYVPPRLSADLVGKQGATKVLWFHKMYAEMSEAQAPDVYVGKSSDVVAAPFMGNTKAMLQVLLPDGPQFDMAVNIFTFQPGATLPMVESHVMEHGLLMLSGQGVYRLEESWYPVIAGDVIWMAPYCPQWFVAMGDEPASYIYYKDINRYFI